MISSSFAASGTTPPTTMTFQIGDFVLLREDPIRSETGEMSGHMSKPYLYSVRSYLYRARVFYVGPDLTVDSYEGEYILRHNQILILQRQNEIDNDGMIDSYFDHFWTEDGKSVIVGRGWSELPFRRRQACMIIYDLDNGWPFSKLRSDLKKKAKTLEAEVGWFSRLASESMLSKIEK